jgi:hypothetical protein
LGYRTSLILPAPQISDNELNAIKKYASGTLTDSTGVHGVGDNNATRALVGNYS